MGDIRLRKTGSTYVNQSVKEDCVLENLNASINQAGLDDCFKA